MTTKPTRKLVLAFGILLLTGLATAQDTNTQQSDGTDAPEPTYDGEPRSDYIYTGTRQDLFERWQDGEISTETFQTATAQGDGTASLELGYEGRPRSDYVYTGDEPSEFEEWRAGEQSTDDFAFNTDQGEGTASLELGYEGRPRSDYIYTGTRQDLFERWQDGEISTYAFQTATAQGDGTASLEPETSDDEDRVQLTQCANAIVDVEGGNRTSALLRQSQGNVRAGNISVIFQYNDAAPMQGYGYISSSRAAERVFVDNPGNVPDDATLSEVTVGIVRQEAPGCTSGPEVTQEFPINVDDDAATGEIDLSVETENPRFGEPVEFNTEQSIDQDGGTGYIYIEEYRYDYDGDSEIEETFDYYPHTPSYTYPQLGVGTGSSKTYDASVEAEVSNGDILRDRVQITVGAADITGNPSPVGEANQPPRDPDDDGTFEDVNGDGEVTREDADLLTDNEDSIPEEDVQFFDPNDNGEIEIFMYVAIGSMVDSKPEPISPSDLSPKDPDDDGKYEDLNGDGALSFSDLLLMEGVSDRVESNPAALPNFNFDTIDDRLVLDGRQSDLTALSEEITQDSPELNEISIITDVQSRSSTLEDIEVRSPGAAFIETEDGSGLIERGTKFTENGDTFAKLERAATIGGVGAISVTETTPPIVYGRPAGDLDSDGKLEDVDGDGNLTAGDVATLAAAIEGDDEALNFTVLDDSTGPFDFNNDGLLGEDDLQELAREVTSQEPRRLVVSNYFETEINDSVTARLETEETLRIGGRLVDLDPGETFTFDGTEVTMTRLTTRSAGNPPIEAAAAVLSSDNNQPPGSQQDQTPEPWSSTELTRGWNFISAPRTPESAALDTEDIIEQCDLESFNGNRFWSLNGGVWEHPDVVPSSKGVLVKTTSGCSVNLTQTVPAASLDSPAGLGAGWNTFSVPEPTTLSEISGSCEFRRPGGKPLWAINNQPQEPIFERLSASDTLDPNQAYYGITENSCQMDSSGQLPGPPTPQGLFAQSTSG